MSDTAASSGVKPIYAAICLDAGVYHRYRAILRHLCVGLIDEIAGVRLLTSAQEAQTLMLGPVQLTLYAEPRWPLRAARMRRLLDSLADRPPSVVHAMSAGSSAVAEMVAAEFDADLVYQITAMDDITAYVSSTHPGPRRVICNSQPLLDRFLATSGVPPEQACLIRPGVVCVDQPSCFTVPDRDATVLTTADLTADSGVERLIEAVRLLGDRNYSFLTFLLGTGSDEHRIRALVRDRGLTTSVVFAQPAGSVLQAMIGADIFVQPGVEQAISARSLQALGLGMAVIGVRGGAHDAYLDEQTALLVEPGDVGALANAIARLLDDHYLAQRLAAGAIAHIKAHHTMSAMAEKTGALYREMALQRATFPLKR